MLRSSTNKLQTNKQTPSKQAITRGHQFVLCEMCGTVYTYLHVINLLQSVRGKNWFIPSSYSDAVLVQDISVFLNLTSLSANGELKQTAPFAVNTREGGSFCVKLSQCPAL